MHNGKIRCKFIDERYGGRDVYADDLLLGEVLKIFDQCAQGIPMRGNHHAFARFDAGTNLLLKIGDHTRDGVLQALGQGELARVDLAVLRVAARVVLVALLQGGRLDVEGAAPNFHLVLPVFLRRLRFVQSL